MRLSSEKLKAFKKQLGRAIVISENGVIKEIEAKDLK
jgi:ribosomal protein S8